jgi:hypothetical protein
VFTLKASGCIAVSGGLEVASDRLLKLIDKGVTVEQVAKVTRNFTEAGVMVHAYLMYGYPTQTIQETVDSLEMVRQLFEGSFARVLASICHDSAQSSGMHPEKFGVVKETEAIGTLQITILIMTARELTTINSLGLKKSLFNFMHGICFDYELQEWFDFKFRRLKFLKTLFFDALQEANFNTKPMPR